MIFYHGTTQKKAEQIIQGGFQPEPPSFAVWFTTDRHYATAHAKGKSGERGDRPIVLACELDLEQLSLQRILHVFQVRRATNLIRTGERIHVDGNRGMITRSD